MKCKLHIIFLASTIIALFSFNATLDATVIAKGGATTTPPDTFTGPVIAKVYDRATGTIYLGVKIPEEIEVKKYKLSKAIRLVGNEKPTFTGIGENNVYAVIEFLTLATETADTSPFLVFAEFDGSTRKKQKKVKIVKNDGTIFKEISTDLKDASGALGEPGQATNGIIGLAANKSFIFAAVRPNESSDEFGDANSGIAVVSINQSTLELTQKAAKANDTGIKAKKLDQTTAQVIIQNPVTFQNNTADLYWDDLLERLYIGLMVRTGTADNDGAKGVVVARVDENGILSLEDIAPNNAFDNQYRNIVGAKKAAETSAPYIIMHHVRIMHCSTGPSYLIVNGDVTTTGTGVVNEYVYALPLVDNPSNEVKHGTLAKKDALLTTNFAFTIPAQNNVDLPQNDEIPFLVGFGALPIETTTPISDIVVVGDTVYVSININPTNLNDSGVFYSQALFDNTGKIIRWTPWTKRALPFNAFPNTTGSKGRVKFFDIDAVTGKVWAVEGSVGKAVCSTAWDLGSGSSSLPARLNQEFHKNLCNKGCFSVLDLDQATRGFTAADTSLTTTHRYALFGGADKVAFAQISRAYDATNVNSPQQIIEVFSQSASFLLTTMESGSGCVHVLEYSRQYTSNYFFAGTEQGLFVFARTSDGSGFNVNQLAALNQPPFTTSKWHKITNLPGSVIDIKSLGNRLYIIMLETSCQIPLTCKLYGIDFDTNITDMFDPSNRFLLAESGTSIFNNAHLFTGIELIATGTSNELGDDAGYMEQLILSTNNGLFNSNASQTGVNRGIISTTNQTEAQWQRLHANNTQPYWSIAGTGAPIPSTVWPITIQDKTGIGRYEHSSIEQLNGSWSSTYTSPEFDFLPPFFNAKSITQAFSALDPITYFWSDGARRFFIINHINDPYCINKLLSFPYNTIEWNIFSPGPHIIFDPAVKTTKRFYWIRHIGASGILMAGTNSGVIALE